MAPKGDNIQYNLVLKDIQELAAMALKDVESFYQRISSRMERRYLADASEMEKERERLEARNREIDDMFLNLYTDKAKGILSEQRFVKLTAAMEREQEENQKQLKELALSLRRSNEQESDVRTFIRELDEGILNRLISRILVDEVKKVDGEKFQKIKIIYNFAKLFTCDYYNFHSLSWMFFIVKCPPVTDLRFIAHGNRGTSFCLMSTFRGIPF